MSFYDEESDKKEEILLKLLPDTLIHSLNKYAVKLETDSLYEDETE
jgi:hypothetical protein